MNNTIRTRAALVFIDITFSHFPLSSTSSNSCTDRAYF